MNLLGLNAEPSLFPVLKFIFLHLGHLEVCISPSHLTPPCPSHRTSTPYELGINANLAFHSCAFLKLTFEMCVVSKDIVPDTWRWRGHASESLKITLTGLNNIVGERRRSETFSPCLKIIYIIKYFTESII